MLCLFWLLVGIVLWWAGAWIASRQPPIVSSSSWDPVTGSPMMTLLAGSKVFFYLVPLSGHCFAIFSFLSLPCSRWVLVFYCLFYKWPVLMSPRAGLTRGLYFCVLGWLIMGS